MLGSEFVLSSQAPAQHSVYLKITSRSHFLSPWDILTINLFLWIKHLLQNPVKMRASWEELEPLVYQLIHTDSCVMLATEKTGTRLRESSHRPTRFHQKGGGKGKNWHRSQGAQSQHHLKLG